MKPVLKLAGKMRRDEDGSDPEETIFLIRAIVHINLPKLITRDIPFFTEIIKVHVVGWPENAYNAGILSVSSQPPSF